MNVAPGQLEQLLYVIAPHQSWWQRYGPPHAGAVLHYFTVAAIITWLRWRIVRAQEARYTRARLARQGRLDQRRRP